MRALITLLLLAAACGSSSPQTTTPAAGVTPDAGPSAAEAQPPGADAASPAARASVSAEHLQWVRTWFAGKQAGHPQLPDKLFLDGQPVDKDEFVEFLNSPNLFVLKEYTPIVYEDTSTVVDQLPGGPFTIISVATGAPAPDCEGEGEDCEGFESIEFFLDEKGVLVAVHAWAAG